MTHISDIELGEVKLKVSNLERSIKFYQEVVGLKMLNQEAKTAELTADGKNALLVLEEIPGAVVVPPRSASGLYHFAILLPTRKDLGLSLRNLIESGIHIGQADHLVSEALYISDPDHNGIEIYRDRPRETWTRDEKGNYNMATDPIDWEGLLEEAKGEAWTGLPAGTTMGHVHVHVSDLQKSKQFYCDVLGFDITANYMSRMGALFISAGGYHHHLGLNIWAGNGAPMPPVNGTGLAYYTIVVPDQEELDNVVGQLRNAGISAEEEAGAWFVKDPSGIQLKLTTK
ncbi:VOC family protein [Paenibacillus abyssi]|uniref:Catechol-2,3-dioxygenase n=1 Tax=Paenibacillus abyssi TaxID=1340531 RepID=A0A917D342_9BACL|nr:VOC family protein [Paenibacillus abyssi]GGG09596.1 catechol-2,3-dioxygenase [Paenibacillus abyssi]